MAGGCRDLDSFFDFARCRGIEPNVCVSEWPASTYRLCFRGHGLFSLFSFDSHLKSTPIVQTPALLGRAHMLDSAALSGFIVTTSVIRVLSSYCFLGI